MEFTYRHQDDSIWIKTDNGNEVRFYCPDNRCEEIELTAGGCIDPKDDDLSGLYILFNGEFRTIASLIYHAEDMITQFNREIEIESVRQARHEESFRY